MLSRQGLPDVRQGVRAQHQRHCGQGRRCHQHTCIQYTTKKGWHTHHAVDLFGVNTLGAGEFFFLLVYSILFFTCLDFSCVDSWAFISIYTAPAWSEGSQSHLDCCWGDAWEEGHKWEGLSLLALHSPSFPLSFPPLHIRFQVLRLTRCNSLMKMILLFILLLILPHKSLLHHVLSVHQQFDGIMPLCSGDGMEQEIWNKNHDGFVCTLWLLVNPKCKNKFCILLQYLTWYPGSALWMCDIQNLTPPFEWQAKDLWKRWNWCWFQNPFWMLFKLLNNLLTCTIIKWIILWIKTVMR